jgi:CheY-like chemotaxis protein
MEAELQKAKKLESVGLLAGGIAHDFNNLLSVILGNVELARDYMHTGNNGKYLEAAIQACFKGKDLTSRLITFSKGGTPLKKIGNLSELIRESYRFAISGSNVNCICDIPDDLWMTEFDEYQMRHALSNIIVNAVESMPEGGVIRIAAENIMTDSDNPKQKKEKYIRLTVQDHGVGIPEQNLPLIFDPYFSTKERGTEKGMGLGLSIAYSIVSKHNGYIFAESEPGKGTSIVIRLPAYSESAPPSAPDAAAVVRTDIPKKPVTERKKILFMDDEKMVRELIEKLLIHLGYSVTTVKDGNEAIIEYRNAMASDNPFFAVILDLTVRDGMGGKEAILKLKETDPDVIAIVSSGYFNDPVMENFSDYGFYGSLPKPYQKKELMHILESIE